MGRKRGESPAMKLLAWVQRQSMKVKALFAFLLIVSSLVALKFIVRDRNHFFVASEAVHFIGIIILIYKLTTQKTCSGLSLKTQELTALFLAVRLYCSFLMEGDIHTMLDFSTLVSTLWVIYMIRFKLKSSYTAELDNMPIYYMIIPSAVLAIFIHPQTLNSQITQILWAFCVYLETVSVLPQLRLMQNAEMVEPFTGHYVFALGIARFLGCAHWILRVYEHGGRYFYYFGRRYLWLVFSLLSEVVQTFILADFCYYYVKSVIKGQLLTSLPCPV